MDLVLSCVDNFEARMAINTVRPPKAQACGSLLSPINNVRNCGTVEKTGSKKQFPKKCPP